MEQRVETLRSERLRLEMMTVDDALVKGDFLT